VPATEVGKLFFGRSVVVEDQRRLGALLESRVYGAGGEAWQTVQRSPGAGHGLRERDELATAEGKRDLDL